MIHAIGFVFALGFCLCLVNFMAHRSGWAMLATLYTGNSEAGSTPILQTIVMGEITYPQCYISTSAAGLHIATLRRFRFGHKSLLLPWRSLNISEGLKEGTLTVQVNDMEGRLITTIQFP